MLIQNLLLILVLIASEAVLIFICNKLHLQFVKVALTISMILLLIFFPIYYFDRHLIVNILKLFYKNQPQIYESFGLFISKSMSISLNAVIYISISLVGVVLVLLVALIIETIKASYELILFIRDLFKSKSKHPSLISEKIIFVEDSFSKENGKNIYLKFCRLLN